MPEGLQEACTPRSGAREIRLFLHAVRLSLKVQGIRRRPLGDVVNSLVRTRSLPRGVATDEAVRAAGRACSRIRRWAGGLDSCLTRSLVAGVLVADRPEVVLHVGFRGARTESLHEGHAWVTLGDRNVTDAADNEHEGPFAEALRVPLQRREAD